ncbi:MAG: UDP-3-O-[3-hydroxymyristoyl] N-acetylglucosamine deacetylase [Candidatus Tokpelaia sp. JSC161]|nr:MAG: UDP-3-O-[3-hydroxymyristoyl] N-acetylglucosamine deacetylase [Candidatus Tokpelaia sp. JSC161]
MNIFQTTLKNQAVFSGYGLHTGDIARVILRPAEENHGIVFFYNERGGQIHRLPADILHTVSTDFCTVLGKGNISIKTIEHLMAAIYASGLDNLKVELFSDEIPILDGGAEFYMKGIRESGFHRQGVARKYLRVLKPCRVKSSSSFAGFSPASVPCFDISISFSSRVIGKQRITFTLDIDYFTRNLAHARTFGFIKDIERLWAAGFALGSSCENSVIIGVDDTVLNPSGLRTYDDFVRHKALDAIGDTALLGYPFLGKFYSFKGGHRINVEASRCLLEKQEYFEIVELR